jgi:hypothetical protein
MSFIRNYKDIGLNLALLVSFTYLLAYYQVGIHDIGVYIDSGKAILHGINPYDPIISRSGTVGPIPLAILDYLLPSKIAPAFFQGLSLASILFFLKNIYPWENKYPYKVAGLLIIWSSPVRELLATNQATGIVLGFVGAGLFLYKGKFVSSELIRSVLVGLSFTLAIDLKPHIAAVFIFAWYIFQRDFKGLIYTGMIFVICHLLIDLSQQRFLELDYIRSMKELTLKATKGQLGDSVSFWPITNNLMNSPQFVNAISYILVILVAAASIYYAYKGIWNKFVFFSFLAPSFSMYFHFYDMIPLVALTIAFTLFSKNVLLSTVTFSMLVIPKIYLDPKNVLLMLILCALINFWDTKRNEMKTIYVIRFACGILISFLIRVLNSSMNLSDHLLQSIVVSECIILTVLVFIKYNYVTSKKGNRDLTF